jgi:hypothetical protein
MSDLNKEPARIISLRAHHKFKTALIGNIIAVLATEDSLRRELSSTIGTIARTVDPKTAFYPIHPFQTNFERLFMSPLMSFGQMFTELIEVFPPQDSQEFLQNLFSLVVHCLDTLKINQKPNDAALVLLLVRFIFDRVYETNEYLRSDGNDIIGKMCNLTLKYLNPPAEFCPHFTPDMLVSDLFRNDEHFMKAISALEMCIFQTNPFDILDCIEKSLTHIEAAAFFFNKGQTFVFPFEVTFGLFLGVALSSQIRNFENIANFVEAYTPLSGLCPAFEFSRAKVVACLMQFKQILKDIEDGKV